MILKPMRLQPINLFFACSAVLMAQYPGLTLPPSGNNQKAAVTQFVGPVQVTIEYSSPAVHGPDGADRRGKIWGTLVPYGLSDLGQFGNRKPDPWRAGANENTVFSLSHESMIEGKPLPAGRYGLHMIPGAQEWTIIFSKNAGAWGSFRYEASEDALRVTVKPRKHEYREWLTYEFTTRKATEATAELQWEEIAVPWTIRVTDANDIYISHLRRELTTVPGFSWQGYQAAAQFCLQNNTNLEDGLKWAEAAVSEPFVGQTNVATLSTKAQILSKLGRDMEASAAMRTAVNLPGTTSLEIHVYGRQLLGEKKVDEAMAMFQLNAAKHGEDWPVHVGLARGYSAKGDLKQALEHARKAAAQAPDPLNKKALEDMVKVLESGKAI